MQNFVVGMNCITYNFADTKSRQLKRVPDNIQGMLRLAAQLSRCTKYKYRFGTSHQLINYTADGTIFDYMAGIQKVRRNFSLKKDLWFLQVHQSLDKIFFLYFRYPFLLLWSCGVNNIKERVVLIYSTLKVMSYR